MSPLRAASILAFASAFALILYELLLTRVFAIVLFADLAHLALGLAMLGISVGSLWVHLRPPQDAVARAATWTVAQGITSVIAVIVALSLRVVAASDASSWYAREPIRFSLLRPGLFLVLLVVVAIPPTFGGAVVSALFRRFRDDVPRIYAADLVGAGLAATLFLPSLWMLAAPDLVFGCLLVTAAGAAVVRRWAWAPAGLGAALLSASLFTNVLRIQYAAGWDERHVVAERWTPLARLGLYDGDVDHGIPGQYLLLDNGSASLIVTTEEQVATLRRHGNRSLVYELYPGQERRVAVLAAGAGPEVAVAQAYGHRDITAIDLAPQMFELVRSAFPGKTPYDRPHVRTLAIDARAAIRLSGRPYGIIQVLQANFLSGAGVLNQAWSPQLLYTREAIGEYLDHLEPDGTLSMASFATEELLPTAIAALEAAHVENPSACARVAGGAGGAVMLVRKQPFTDADLATIDRVFPPFHRDGSLPPPPATVLTDDHPHPDNVRDLPALLRGGGALPLIYGTLLLQLAVTAVAGLLFIGVPWGLRGRGAVGPLAYAAALGYGYFAIEITLLHRLVIYVGHPTWAVATVVASMLLGSGLGSFFADRTRVSPARAIAVALAVAAVSWGLVLPAAQAWLGFADFGVRMGVAAVAIAPLAIVLGLPMPLGLRRFGRDEAVIPWMWAMNGWASAGASVLTVLVVRFFGYTAAFGTGLLAYAVALWIAGLPGEAEREGPGGNGLGSP